MKANGVEVDRGCRQSGVPGRGEAGLGQVRGRARRADRAHPGGAISTSAQDPGPAPPRADRAAVFLRGGSAEMQARYIGAMERCIACAWSSRRLPRRHHDHHPVGRVHPLRANYGSSWPEPLAVLLMIWFSFIAAALCYRESCTSASRSCPMLLRAAPLADRLAGRALHGGINLFMLGLGHALVHTTWFQAIADFPMVSVGISYLPVPIGGAITLLFVIERLWTGGLFEEPADGQQLPRVAHRYGARHGHSRSCSAAFASSAPSACRSPTRSGSRPSSRRCGSTSRSRR